MSEQLQILIGDCRQTLAELDEKSVQCCVTSPPYYGLRDYGHDGQIGLEQTPDEYVAEMVKVFAAVKRVLREDGVLFLNLGDTYAANRTYQVSPTKWDSLPQGQSSSVPAGLKQKDLIGIPWRVAFALQRDGWYLRQDIIWHKPNPMPESVKDRCTKAHEYVFLLSKSARYYWDPEAIAEKAVWGGYKDAETFSGKNGKTDGSVWKDKGSDTCNKRSVWSITTQPYAGAHFATMPPKLAEACILAGSKAGDVILDPFGGSGTTGMVALENGRKAILCEINNDYVKLIRERTSVTVGFGF